MSHPSRVRGLKQKKLLKADFSNVSHPSRVLGLKQDYMGLPTQGQVASHPSWVRGLKLKVQSLRIAYGNVAPLAGAWIETMHNHQRLQ